ncbi:hypothetical protein D6853_00060 [Butyrivibrio sp. X503]|uniref:hypothetical protein n=1 Tax=Butyrivibrio sp. X503 TaxID=2364878 RepID=UPI000EA867C8|nr:hypothetical protein [Butyrivibrio sp. X503]RKM57974.1 hypothetical protein D6853_00060 [Butyrivibrio sp. X503]
MKVVIALASAGVLTLIPFVGVCAWDTVNTYLLANCPLRSEGWDGGNKITDMYKNDTIVYYADRFGSDSEYNYIKHNPTNKYGYVDHNYVYY